VDLPNKIHWVFWVCAQLSEPCTMMAYVISNLSIVDAVAAAVMSMHLEVSVADAGLTSSHQSCRTGSAGEVTDRPAVYRSDCHSTDCRLVSVAATPRGLLRCSVEPFHSQPVPRPHRWHHRRTTGSCCSSETDIRCSQERPNCLLAAANYHRPPAYDRRTHIHHLNTQHNSNK